MLYELLKKIKFKYFILFFLVFNITESVYSQDQEHKALEEEIKTYNRSGKYVESILKLESVISDENSTHYDRFNAYILKSATYKSVFNYPAATENLNMALAEGLESDKKEYVKAIVLIERIFIAFDSLDFDEVEELMKDVTDEVIEYQTPVSTAFYYNILAVLKIKAGDPEGTAEQLEISEKTLTATAPEHLPLVYSKKILLAREINEPDKAVEAFEKGIALAKQYKMLPYEMLLNRDMSEFYIHQNDYKNSSIHMRREFEILAELNPPVRSGEMEIVEKNIQKTKTDLELRNKKNVNIFLMIISVILLLLIISVARLFQLSKSKRRLIETENKEMRNQLTALSLELSEKGEPKIKTQKYKLSERQLEIIELVKEGKTNKEIGELLFISENTVKYHLKIIYSELGIYKRTELG